METGLGAEKLHDLKEQLKRRHIVSFFTTPDDLRARILHDIPDLLKEIGAEVSDKLDLPESASDTHVLRQFKKLPKMFFGRQVTIEFLNDGDFRSAFAEECAALGLEMGASVSLYAMLGAGEGFRIFGERDVAITLCQLPNNLRVRAIAVTAFGVYQRVDWTDEGPVVTPELETGLIVKEILDTQPVGSTPASP